MKKASIRDFVSVLRRSNACCIKAKRSRLRNDGGLLRALFQNMRKSTCKCPTSSNDCARSTATKRSRSAVRN